MVPRCSLRPYLWGGGGPNSFDCSGLVYFCYTYGSPIPGVHDGSMKEATSHRWTTATIMTMGQAVYGPGMVISPGDLIMPTRTHVGICIGNNKYINAPEAGKHVRIDSFNPATVFSVRRIARPCSLEEANRLTKAGTSVEGLPLDPTGRAASNLDEGRAVAVSPLELMEDALDSIVSPLAALAHIFGWLSEPHNWLRIGEVVGGSVALVMAARMMAGRVTK